MNSSLAERVAVAVAGVPLILLLVYVGGWPYAIVVGLALAVGAGEFAALRYHWRPLEDWAAPLAVLSMALAAAISERAWAVNLPFALALPLLAAVIVRRPRPREARFGNDRPAVAAWLFAAAVYVGVLGSTFVLLREVDDGRDWVYLALLSTYAADTAAYFTGRAIGRHRMAPAISPKKTWEGFAGGCAGAFAAVLLLNYFLGLREPAAAMIALGVLLPLFAAAGDLFESWLKRRAGVKDTSELIPGHGGVLDRLDSLLFTFALAYVFARWWV